MQKALGRQKKKKKKRRKKEKKKRKMLREDGKTLYVTQMYLITWTVVLNGVISRVHKKVTFAEEKFMGYNFVECISLSITSKYLIRNIQGIDGVCVSICVAMYFHLYDFRLEYV